jgi:hypothetical protein
MNTEWKLLCVDAINICGRKNTDCLKCEVRCTEIIKAAQKKLLDYLIENRFSDISQHSTDERVYLQQLRKQLETAR